MKYTIVVLILFFLLSCDSQDNCDILEIDSTKEKIPYEFKSKVKHPYKLDGKVNLYANDTIILNNVKIASIDTSYVINATDFYGSATITLDYDRYKATKVEILYKYCFY